MHIRLISTLNINTAYKKENPADHCRVLPSPFLRKEGKGRGETGGRTYGET